MNETLAYKVEYPEEIIGGEVVMMSPAKSDHNRVKHNIAWLLKIFCEVNDPNFFLMAKDYTWM